MQVPKEWQRYLDRSKPLDWRSRARLGNSRVGSKHVGSKSNGPEVLDDLHPLIIPSHVGI